jgi:SAM-dependent methyltransferase
VLELGCGDAGNLAPMADALPQATFTGVDAAPGAIARGRALAAAAGLGNLTLHEAAIEGFDPDPRSFDYVIAHGVYSWVAPPVRDRLLALCARALAEGGVAFVSYNALPGGRLRQALRDMLLFHTAAVDDPQARIAEARALLRFLLEGWPGESELAAALRPQAGRLLERGDASLFHDDLAEVSDPVAFHEFAAHAARHGLRYLAEADFFEMQTPAEPERVAAALLAVEDPIRREQYLDFLKGRMFRQTLLCHAAAPVDRAPRPAVVERLAVSSPATPSGPPDADGRVAFEGPTGSTLTTDHPLVIAALERAGAGWPRALWVSEAIPADCAVGERTALCDALLRAYAANLVQLHAHPPRLAAAPGERPRASALARHQAATGDLVTNLRHVGVRLEDDLARRLVALLDGTRDRAALAVALRAHLQASGATVPGDLGDALERALQGLAAHALLQA